MQNIVTNNVNFGMALYMPTYKKFSKQFGVNIANEIELVRPALTKLAQDVDIFVKPEKYWFDVEDPNCWGLMMTANSVDKPFMAKIRHLAKIYSLREKIKGFVFVPVAQKQNPMNANSKNAPALQNLNEIIIKSVSQIKSEVL